MLQDLFRALRSHGASDCGAVGLSHILPSMTPEQQEETFRRMPDAKTIVCAIYSYNASDEQDANICRYARGLDYHPVIRKRLTAAAEEMPSGQFLPLVDSSPIPESRCAALCGLGVFGQNGLLLHPVIGSRFFIGTLLTDLPCSNIPYPIQNCIGCGACVRACPTQALHMENGKASFSYTKCISDLTQRKGEVTPEEAEILRQAKYIWGCDCCSDACPANRNAPLSTLPEFRENLLLRLDKTDLEGLSNRTFAEKYRDRAFTWRGPAPLRRNLALKEGSDL